MEKLPILPEILYTWDLENKLIEEAKHKVETLEWMNNSTNLISKQKDLFRHSDFSDLTSVITSNLQELKQDLGLRCERLEISLMWANKTFSGGSHHPHFHQASWASGIIYLTDSGSETWFIESNYWPKPEVMPIYLDEPRTSKVHKYPTTKNKMVVFPSSLQHGASVHSDVVPRYSISFNSLPCGVVGDPEQLFGYNVSSFD